MDDSVANNPTLRIMLETARTWGVSPSRFSGREMVQTTVYERDLTGQVVRAITTTSPEWTEEDRQLAVELADYEATLCPGCRHPRTETMNPENEFRYQVEPAIRCHRCTTSAKAMNKYEESDTPSALYVPIVLRGTHEDHLPS